MAVEELTIRAQLRDDLSRPLRRAEEAVEDLGDEVDNVSSKAKRADRELASLGGGVGKLTKLVGGGLVKAAKLGAVALTGIGIAGVAGLTKVVGLASDAGETASKFATVFADQQAEMSAWAEEMHQAYGITTKDLQDAASTFGVFGKAAGVADSELAGFSKDLVGAGTDLASFYNAPVEDVFLALRSGLSGEAEPLRQFGIFLSDASLNAYALEQGIGKTVQEMSDAEKVQLRQAFILGNMGDAQGDLARTSDSLANTTKALKGRLTEAGTAIGTAFLPYAQTAAAHLNTWVADLMPTLQHYLGLVPGLVDQAAGAFGRLSDKWGEGASYGEMANGVLNELGVYGVDLEPIINTVADVLGDLGTIVTDLVIPAISDASSLLPGFTSPLEVARDVIGFVADNASTLAPIVSGLIVGFTAWKVATFALNAVMAVQNALSFLAIARSSGLAAAQLAATGSTGALAAGTGILNAVMALNPVVLVVAALAALAAGLYLAYQKSETFRGIVQGIWEWLQKAADAVVGFLDKFHPLPVLIRKLGGLKGIAEKVRGAFDAVKRAVGKVVDKIGDLIEKAKNIPGAGVVGKIAGAFGDTSTPKGGAGGNLASTLSTHAAISGTGPRITNALVGGFAGSDHHAGRALDLKGSNLISYARKVRALGGYASFHGAGRERHLHAAYGDTPTPRARAQASAPASSSSGPALVLNGPLIGQVNASAEVDVERAAKRALDAWVRDRAERS